MEVVCLTLPAFIEIVEQHLAGFGLADDGVTPIRKLDRQARHDSGEESCRTGDRFGEMQTTAGRRYGDRIAHLGGDRDDVGQD